MCVNLYKYLPLYSVLHAPTMCNCACTCLVHLHRVHTIPLQGHALIYTTLDCSILYTRVRSDFLQHPYAILHISTICPISHANINFAKFCTKNEDIAKINFSESASLRFFCLPLRQKPSLSILLTA